MAEAKKRGRPPKKATTAKKAPAKKKVTLLSLSEALDKLDADNDVKVSRKCWSDTEYMYKAGAIYFVVRDGRPAERIQAFPRDMVEHDYYVV